MSFAVAILGRPNVGKSTLFNRLVGSRAALVDDTPGVTRDRREGAGRIADLEFRAIDTAGLEEAAPASLAARMQAQTERALADADVALLVIDAREGVTEADRHFADWLRRAASRWSWSPTRPKAARPCPASAKPIGSASATRCRSRPSMAKGWPGFTNGWRRSAAVPRWPQDMAPDAPAKPLATRHRRPPECRQIDPGQSPDRRGAAADRSRGRDHPRCDRGRLGLAGPADPPGRHRRHAPPAAGRRQDRAAFGRRCAAHDPLCRDRRSGARRIAAARAAGFDDRPAGRRGGAGIGAGGDQMGRGSERRRGDQSSCASGCRYRCRSCRASPWCRFRG